MKRTLVLSGTFCFVVASMIYAALNKGIWYDEMWSVFMGRHDLPLGQTYWLRWAYDVHPPLFYFTGWLFEPLTGSSIGAKRLLNLIPLTGSLAAICLISAKLKRPDLLVAGLLVLANPLSFDFFIQHRPYFGMIAAWSVTCVALAAIEGRDYERDDLWLALVLGVATLFAFNLQYFCGLMTAALTAPFIVSNWLAGRPRWAVIIAGVATVAGLLVVVQAALQASQLAEVGRHFWATTTTFQAVRIAAEVVAFAALANIVAIVLFALARPRAPFVVVSSVAVAFAVAVALAANVMRPIVVRQYLSPLMPMVVVAIVVGASGSVQRMGENNGRKRWLLGLLVANVVLVAGANAYRRASVKDADELASFIAAQARSCPSTKVVGIPHWTLRDDGMFLLRNEPLVVRDGYRNLAARYGFKLASPTDPRPQACPTILWAEKIGPGLSPRDAARRAGIKVEADGAALVTSGTGVAYVYP